MLLSGNSSEFADLIARLKLMNDALSEYYDEEWQYGDCRDETLEFLGKLQSTPSLAESIEVLTAAFRDPLESFGIMYYFKVCIHVPCF